MSGVKERIVGAVTVMSDKEMAALKAYHNGEPEFRPAVTQEESIRSLGLE